MKTLDQLLMDATLEQFSSRLDPIINEASWSAENRDQKIQDVHLLAEESAKAGELFVSTLLTPTEDGSLLSLSLKREFIGGFYQFLENWRINLDTNTEAELTNSPVTYEWLTAKIRELYPIIVGLDEKIDRLSRNTGSLSVEEL